MEEILQMSNKELDRYHILKKVMARSISQVKAGELLGISDRQVRNLLHHLQREGPRALISKKRGMRGNNKKPASLREQVLQLIQSQYTDFGPTLACEKLREVHKINLSSETVRQWMIQWLLWIPKKSKRRLHPPRPRRECFGELDQADGSHHRWFGPDRDKCTLLVFIDDATGKLTSLHMCKEETLLDYFIALEKRMKNSGRPRALYTDHFSVFDNHCEESGRDLTQFKRACRLLDIDLLLAPTPQAKGRVERVNRTLQDRLIKELKSRNITTIEEANAFLPEYMEMFNRRFSQEPICAFNANRPLENHLDLDRILCRYEERTLTKDLVFQYHKRFFQVLNYPFINRARGKKIEVRETRSGKMRVFMDTLELQVAPLDEIIVPLKRPSAKLKGLWKARATERITKNHPWKRYGYQIALANKIKRAM